MSRSTPNVSSGEVSEVESTLESMLAAAGPPLARCRTAAGSFCIARAAAGSMRGARAQVVDDAFERLNLRGELAGR